MTCEDCEYYISEEGICGAFECNGIIALNYRVRRREQRDE